MVVTAPKTGSKVERSVLWTNDIALSALPWWRTDERVAVDSQIGTLFCDGSMEIGGKRCATAGTTVWQHIVTTLPRLPWSETRLLRANWEWPRAVAVPGAVLIATTVDVTTNSWNLLYLIHEAIHQWIGCVVARPSDPSEAAWMEAWVDAAAWRAVEETHPSTGNAFKSLFTRYEDTKEWRTHALRVADARAQLPSMSDLSTRLTPFVDNLARGIRAEFQSTEWNTGRP